jgi:benzoyl-CoA reductase/2-hydroxyglutaryl-CoA dehydratase subunit BcrC/BadD/HgdB
MRLLFLFIEEVVMPKDAKVSRKKIRSTPHFKRIMEEHFREADSASKHPDQKVAWCTSVGPAELLTSFGFKLYFPENHGAMLGTTRLSTDYIPYANAAGYSPEICSYLTSDVGAYLKSETPLTKAYDIKSIPRPDVLVYNTNQCRDVQEWLSYYSREFNVPIMGVNAPKAVDVLEEHHIKDAESQLEAMVEPLEKISGNKFDPQELAKVVRLSKEATDLWKGVLDTAMNVPSPLTFFDGVIHMGPIVVMRGLEKAVDYYKELKTEMEERVKDGVGAVDDEKFRLYWDGMPIWGKLRPLSEQLYNLKTCVVASTYCNSWIFDSFNPDNPFYTMAKAYTEIFINRSERIKEQYIADLVTKFKIDGIIFHDSRTCPNNSNARYGMPGRMREKFGIPSLIISGDLNDLRCYSEEQAKTNIEAFIEQLEEGKGE